MPSSTELRPIRVAVFDLQVLEDVDIKAPAVTDRINSMLSAMHEVTIVNRDQIARVAAAPAKFA